MPDLQQLLRDHYHDPFHRGECDSPTHAAMRQCALSDCQLAFEMRIDGTGIVEQIWFDGAGCEVCEGLASMLAGFCEGKRSSMLWTSTTNGLIEAMELKDFNQTQLPPCASLPFETLRDALLGSLEAFDDDLADGTNFGGPSLREEC